MNRRLLIHSRENGISMDYCIYKVRNKEEILLWAKENKDRKTKGFKYEIGWFNYKTNKFKKGKDYSKRIISKSVVNDFILDAFKSWVKVGVFLNFLKKGKIY